MPGTVEFLCAGRLPVGRVSARPHGELGAAFVAMPGHKGLYGPQGTGLFALRAETHPLLMGGTGSASALQAMPDFLPDRLEAGTTTCPALPACWRDFVMFRHRGRSVF